LLGHGGWRTTVHRRQYTSGPFPRDTLISELPDARSRKLTQAWNKPAVYSFTLDGHSPTAKAVTELSCDVIAWRWNDAQQRDIPMFRGPVVQSQDTLSEQTATVVFTAQDYLAMLARRFWTGTSTFGWAGFDQDTIASGIISQAGNVADSTGVSFSPGSFLPLTVELLDPGGNNRGLSGQIRTRTYQAQTPYLTSLDQLANVINGFDYDVLPGGGGASLDSVRLFYPYQGVQRTDVQLMYGTTVAAMTRSLNSADYANYQRTIGNNGTATPNAAQLIGEAYNSDTNNVTVASQGLWMDGDNVSDVSVAQTLNDHANGNLNRSAVIVPSYSVQLRPGWYDPMVGPNMGDVVPLIVNEGRLALNTTVRVLGIDYAVSDDVLGEDVTLTLGRPDVTIADIFSASAADVDALARR
jgi:hypothetical protein